MGENHNENGRKGWDFYWGILNYTATEVCNVDLTSHPSVGGMRGRYERVDLHIDFIVEEHPECQYPGALPSSISSSGVHAPIGCFACHSVGNEVILTAMFRDLVYGGKVGVALSLLDGKPYYVTVNRGGIPSEVKEKGWALKLWNLVDYEGDAKRIVVNALEKYNARFERPYLEGLLKILSNAPSLEDNLTVSTDEGKLTVSLMEDVVIVKWRRIVGEIECVKAYFELVAALEDGITYCIIDQWDIYRIASREVNVPKEEVEATSLELLRTENYTVLGLRSKLIWGNHHSLSKNPYLLYPLWCIEADAEHLGWRPPRSKRTLLFRADTGEALWGPDDPAAVCVNEYTMDQGVGWRYIPPETEGLEQPPLLFYMYIALITVAVAAFGFYMHRKARSYKAEQR